MRKIGHPTGRAVPSLTVAFLAALTIMLAGTVFTPPALGQEAPASPAGCATEVEPNDSPDQATAIADGVCVSGTLPENDQDLVLWELPVSGASTTWAITLDGVPGGRTVADLRPITSEPGVMPLAVGGPILTLAVEPDAPGPTRREGLLIAPGRYLVGVSAGGQAPAAGTGAALGAGGPGSGATVLQPYRLVLEAAAPLPAAIESEPNDDGATATRVSGSFSLAGDLAGSADVYRWIVPADAGAWTLRTSSQLGVPGSLTLSSADRSSTLVRAQSVDGRIELPDLVLQPGDYLLTVEPAGAMTAPYLLSAEAMDAPAADPEPNDTQDRAVPLAGDRPLARGRLGRPQDEDWYRLDVDDALASGTVDIRMLWRSGLRRELCIFGSSASALLCRDATTGLNVSGLSLLAGRYELRVRGDVAPDDVYLIRVDPAGDVSPDFEREPNDTPETATPLDTDVVARARASGTDVDHYRVRVSGEPELWQIDAAGSGLSALEWIRPDGQQLAGAAAVADGTGAELTDLYLVPGEHWFRVSAVDGDYTLALTPLGPPDPNAEREPNDLPAREERLIVGRQRVGRLPTMSDTDVYGFSVRGDDHLLLVVQSPDDGALDVLLTDGIDMSRRLRASPGEPLRDDLLLGPGDYRVLLSPVEPSQSRYSIELERLDPYVLAVDQEPNDSPRQARPLSASGTVTGTAPTGTDSDWFRLPASADGAPLQVRADGDITNLTLLAGTNPQTLLLQPDGSTYLSGPLTPAIPLLLRVDTIGPYSLSLGDGQEGPGIAGGTTGLAADLTLADGTVAAWWPTGQRLDGVVRLTNDQPDEVELRLVAHVTDASWQVALAPGPVVVPASGATEVPLTITVPREVPGDGPVRITVRAMDAGGASVTTSVDIHPSRDALPVEQARAWPIPAELLGGLDVAALALGASPIPSLDLDGEARLHDGSVAADWGLSYPIAGLPVSLTVDLAGDEPLPVAGTIIQPLSVDPTLGDTAREFELALSMDGATWDTVLQGTLQPVAMEQSFVFPTPVLARYAQLRVTSVQRELPSRLDLGEWKVVATPGWSPASGPLDLSDGRAGGHVVWMSPQPDSREQVASLLDDTAGPGPLSVKPGSNVEWTLGFMHDRVARVSSLEWRDPQPSDARARLKQVEVLASLDSPLGPWRSLGSWTLARADDGSVSPFIPEQPTWARFLRLSGHAGMKQTQVELPDRVRVLEVAQGGDYRSVLGQWGMGNPEGPFEWTTPPPQLEPDAEPGGPDDASNPRALTEGHTATGRVHFGVDSDWYRFSVPEGRHSLALTLRGPYSVGTALTLRTIGGDAVPMTFAPGEATGSVTYRAAVEPGASYLVEVSQPQSSIVVSFDSSASVATHLSAIESGLRGLAEGMVADREAVRIVPFDNEPLMSDWSSDPYQVADAVNRFRLGGSSSAAERNLREAATDLAAREGGRAVLLITDAASSSFDETARLWAALASSRPRVFTVAVGGEGEVPATVRGELMADWAASAGGVAELALGGEDILGAFDRLATWLRRPAAYQLEYQTLAEELSPPEPGHVTVVAPEVQGRRPAILGGNAAIELVLDVSGSMRDPLGDRPRIDVAKAVLTGLVRDDIPGGAPVALRMFPSASDSCGSSLLGPLAPLDPATMIAAIGQLDIPPKARTPLAQAIASVAQDMERVQGPRIVVLVSDGKESCKGDPKTAVEQLRAEGVDVTVNVVGLALDKKSRKAIARLADVGGGTYFDATDAETLGAALRAAVSAGFEVRDQTGAIVARGTVGGQPVTVPSGRYEIVVGSEPVETFTNVYVRPDGDVTLTLPRPGTDP